MLVLFGGKRPIESYTCQDIGRYILSGHSFNVPFSIHNKLYMFTLMENIYGTKA